MVAVRKRTGAGHGLNDNRRPTPPRRLRPGPRPMGRYPLPKPKFRLPRDPAHWPRPPGNLLPPFLRFGKNLYRMAEAYYSSPYGRQNPGTAGLLSASVTMAVGTVTVSRICLCRQTVNIKSR